MVGSWVGVALSMSLLCFVGGYGRRIVRKNAPFYGKSNILIVGITFGVVVGVITHFLARWVSSSLVVLGVLSFWGLLTTLYLGYKPNPNDWANKADQTAMFATIGYVVVSGGLFFL